MNFTPNETITIIGAILLAFIIVFKTIRLIAK